MHDKDNLTPYLPGLEKEHEWTCKNETELCVNLFNQLILLIVTTSPRNANCVYNSLRPLN